MLPTTQLSSLSSLMCDLSNADLREWRAVCPLLFGAPSSLFRGRTADDDGANDRKTPIARQTGAPGMLAGSNAAPVQAGPCRLQSAKLRSGVCVIVAKPLKPPA